jgi:glycosyltransferase involved in cell wall biosynthesis
MESEKIHVVYIIENLGVGGPQRIILDLVNNIDRSNFKVSIISLLDNKIMCDAYPNLEDVDVYVCSSFSKSLSFPWINLSILKNVFSLIRKLNPDIIHSHLWSITNFNIYFPAFFFRKIKWVHTLHSTGGYFNEPGLKNFLFRLIEKYAQVISDATTVVISEAVQKTADELNLKKTVLINNGVNTQKFFPKRSIRNGVMGLEDEDIVLIFPARYQPSKGHLCLLKAYKLLLNDFDNLKLILAGDALEENLSAFISANGMSSSVIILEQRNDVDYLLSLADIGVFPSEYEGLPLVLCEMMSAQLPVVATKIPPIIEITRNGEGASLVPVNNENALAKAIKNVILSKEYRDRISVTARSIIIERFSVEKMVSQHERLYQEL